MIICGMVLQCAKGWTSYSRSDNHCCT